MNESQLKEIQEYRYERKFFLSDLVREEVEHIILSNPAAFNEIYNERFINNIYLDSFEMINFYENVEGNSERMKYRIRWYGDLFGRVEKPVLELKIKNGLLGRKESFILRPFTFRAPFDSNSLQELFTDSDIPKDIKRKLRKQMPTLVNRYRRKYYQSFNKNYRITIDDDQIFYRIKKFRNQFGTYQKDKINVIVELKYDQSLFNEAEIISNSFPFRMTKSSKYVRGIEIVF